MKKIIKDDDYETPKHLQKKKFLTTTKGITVSYNMKKFL